MYKKLGCYIDKKNFGNKVIVYKGEQDYFIVIKDREEIVYYFVDNNIEKLYPMNSYMKNIKFAYNEEINDIDCISVSLSSYGYSNCTKHLKIIIKNIIASSLNINEL